MLLRLNMCLAPAFLNLTFPQLTLYFNYIPFYLVLSNLGFLLYTFCLFLLVRNMKSLLLSPFILASCLIVQYMFGPF